MCELFLFLEIISALASGETFERQNETLSSDESKLSDVLLYFFFELKFLRELHFEMVTS